MALGRPKVPVIRPGCLLVVLAAVLLAVAACWHGPQWLGLP